MDEKVMLIIKAILLLVTGISAVQSDETSQIKLEVTSFCSSSATIEWIMFIKDDMRGLTNCSVLYGLTEDFINNDLLKSKDYAFMQNLGKVSLPSLTAESNYSVQIMCGPITSNIVFFSTDDTDCSNQQSVTVSESPVVEFKEQSTLLGTRDSVLGIVFALLGLLIILVTTIFIVKKLRRRHRLERIRRYLGSSLIDPFENLQNIRTSSIGNGSERLMGSTDSLS